MLSFLKKGLSKTFNNIEQNVVQKRAYILKDELEDLLLEADVAYEIIEEIIYYLPPQDKVKRADLQRVLKAYFIYDEPTKEAIDVKPFVELVMGVNGAGKTTSIAKLAKLYKKQNKRVLLGASDTFRAAAIEQLRRWAEKLGIDIIYTKQGHDPSAVAFDAISSGVAKKFDHVIIDTAGRLHNQKNLANELKKIVRICDKAYEGAPHKKILVLDGTQGNSAIEQAKSFHEIAKVDGVIITKLDGTAKGGALFGVARELQLPILYVGVGEGEDDFTSFDPDEYIDGLCDAIFSEETDG